MPGRLARVLLAAGLVAALAGGLTFGAAALNGRSGPPPASDPVPAAAFEQLSSAGLAAGIGQLQQHLRAQPRDAKLANGLGYRNALFLYHQGMIEKSLGRPADARRDLTAALRLNPHFSVLHAPLAMAALASLGGTR